MLLAATEDGSIQGGRHLILTRRASEGMVIGEDIAIRALGIRRNAAHVGIETSKDVAV